MLKLRSKYFETFEKKKEKEKKVFQISCKTEALNLFAQPGY